MQDSPSSQDQPRPAEDTGVLPAAPGTGTTDTQLLRETRTLADGRSEFPLPQARSRRVVYLLAAVLLIAAAAAVAFKLYFSP